MTLLPESFLQGGGWAVFAAIAAVFSAAIYLVNQYMRQPGYLLVFWMRVLVVAVMTPVMVYIPWPDDPTFYIATLATVFFASYGDIKTFNVAAVYGGGVVSRLQPLIVWASFVAWFFFDPALLFSYLAHPINTLGILASLGGCVYFAMRLNRCAVTRAAFFEILPALGAYTVTTVLGKYAMTHGAPTSAVYGYMYVQSAAAALVMGVYALFRAHNDVTEVRWANTTLLAATGLAGAAWLGHMVFKGYAVVYTPNPSYQAAINLSAPVFIAVYYKLTQHKEEADSLSGFGVVACAIALVLLTIRH